ncbi:MAG: DMT family transporter [Thermoleophilia bacterium]|nr:DMT family transporter [Thermoleophilia bacterium]
MSGAPAAVLVCLAAGFAGAVQAAVMGRFGERIGVVEALAFAALVTATVALASLALARQSLSGLLEGARSPVWMWSAGVMSAFIVFAVALGPPRIGTTTTIALIITGNLTMAAVVDRYGLFGLDRIGLTPVRMLGLLLLAVGAALTLYRP